MTDLNGRIEPLFPTLVYRADAAAPEKLIGDLERLALAIGADDAKGQRWSMKHGFGGYTSYGSIDDLCERFAPLHRLELIIERHARRFVKALHWDVRGARPYVDSLWINVLMEGGSHTSHLHTNAVLSGTYYVTVPAGSGALVFEDPRHAMMMAAPPRTAAAPREMQTYVSETPLAGTLLLWESWLRHEVAMHRAAEDRISISFNCVLR
jgi:uncharacterized protein (TIGR02466 family)